MSRYEVPRSYWSQVIDDVVVRWEIGPYCYDTEWRAIKEDRQRVETPDEAGQWPLFDMAADAD